MPYKYNPPIQAQSSSLQARSSSAGNRHRPVVVTSADDDTVGAMLPNPTTTLGYYADVAIELPTTGAQSSLTCAFPRAHGHSLLRKLQRFDTLRHIRSLTARRPSSRGTPLSSPACARNCLIAGVGQVFACTNSTVQAEHLTVDWCNILDRRTRLLPLTVQNSIFARVISLGAARAS